MPRGSNAQNELLGVAALHSDLAVGSVGRRVHRDNVLRSGHADVWLIASCTAARVARNGSAANRLMFAITSVLHHAQLAPAIELLMRAPPALPQRRMVADESVQVI